jgi:acetylornithine deacetylase/succinyl-diaminopimelate desuccinylase-like protein
VAEKGTCWLRLRFHGAPGHGSTPEPDSAVLKAAAAVDALGKKTFPLHVTKAAGSFLHELSRHLPQPNATVVRYLTVPCLSEFLCRRVLPDKKVANTFLAILHNTATPTILRAGEKTNVIPSTATVEVDGRLLPGIPPEVFLQELRRIIGTDFEYEILNHSPGVESDVSGDPLFRQISTVLQRHDPNGIVLPYMIPGFTDGAYYSRLGMKCLGFSPIRLPEDMKFGALFHGHDERIPVEGFNFGVRVLTETMLEFAQE